MILAYLLSPSKDGMTGFRNILADTPWDTALPAAEPTIAKNGPREFVQALLAQISRAFRRVPRLGGKPRKLWSVPTVARPARNCSAGDRAWRCEPILSVRPVGQCPHRHAEPTSGPGASLCRIADCAGTGELARRSDCARHVPAIVRRELSQMLEHTGRCCCRDRAMEKAA